MRRTGFTFIEVLLAMGVLAAVAGLAAPTYRNYQIRSDLYLAEDVVLQALYRSRLLSQSGQDDDAWRYQVAEGLVYKGDDFTNRDAAYDETFALPDSVAVTGIQEVAFSRISGAPSPDGDIVLESLNGEKLWIPISPDTAIIGEGPPPVQFKVRFDRTDDNDGYIIICHKPGTASEETKTLPEQAWFGHRSHGDTAGECGQPGEEVQNVVYVGADAVEYHDGQWIPLTDNGTRIIDGEPPYDKTGIYAKRTADHLEITHYNQNQPDLKTMIDIVVIFDSANITTTENAADPNGAENPFDGTVNDSGSQDEVTPAPDNRSVLYQTRAEDDRDTILIDWSQSY